MPLFWPVLQLHAVGEQVGRGEHLQHGCSRLTRHPTEVEATGVGEHHEWRFLPDDLGVGEDRRTGTDRSGDLRLGDLGDPGLPVLTDRLQDGHIDVTDRPGPQRVHLDTRQRFGVVGGRAPGGGRLVDELLVPRPGSPAGPGQ